MAKFKQNATNNQTSPLLGINGDLKLTLPNKNPFSVNSQRDLGLMVPSKLKWNKNCKRRATEAIGASFQIIRGLKNQCSTFTKLNAYTRYVVPIVTYASQAWFLSKKKLRMVQKRATKWILWSSKSYTEKMMGLKLLPFSLYIKTHDIFNSHT